VHRHHGRRETKRDTLCEQSTCPRGSRAPVEGVFGEPLVLRDD
jgi:hypothetical protein